MERFAVVIVKGWDGGLSRIERKVLTTEGHELLFTAALFPRAKVQKQPKSPSLNDGLKKRWYLHTMHSYYSRVKKNEI